MTDKDFYKAYYGWLAVIGLSIVGVSKLCNWLIN